MILELWNTYRKVSWDWTQLRDAGWVLYPRTSSLPPGCKQLWRPQGKRLALLPPPPPIALQFSHFRRLPNEESLLKYRLPGSTSGISDSRLWAEPQNLYFQQVPSWHWCCWFRDYTEDHSSRANCSLLCAALVGSVVSFRFPPSRWLLCLLRSLWGLLKKELFAGLGKGQ